MTAPLSLAQRLALIADEMRSLADNGQHYTDDPYQIVRFERLRTLAAELQALTDTRPLADIQAIFSADLALKSPLAVVDIAVIDPAGRCLLIRRADDGLWAMPGGMCDTGETPAQAATRETWEETGVQVEITHLLGAFDSRLNGATSGRQLYVFLFAAVPISGEPQISHETLDVRWFELADLPWGAFSPGHEFRLQHALAWWLQPSTRPFFDRP